MDMLFGLINHMQLVWSTSKFRFFLNYTKLGDFFNRSATQDHPINPCDFMITYLNSSAYLRWWFRLYLTDYHRHVLDQLTLSFKRLQDNNLLNADNLRDLFGHPRLMSFSQGLIILSNNGLLTQDNIAALAWLERPLRSEQRFNDLIVDGEYFLQPVNTASMLVCLSQANILTNENRRILHEHVNPESLARAVLCLEQDLLTKNFSALASEVNPLEHVWIIQSANKSNTVTPGNFNVSDDQVLIMERPQAVYPTSISTGLHEHGIFATPATFVKSNTTIPLFAP